MGGGHDAWKLSSSSPITVTHIHTHTSGGWTQREAEQHMHSAYVLVFKVGDAGEMAQQSRILAALAVED